MTEVLWMLAVFGVSFVLSYFLIQKVPPRLHSPLMSMTNAVSGVTILGTLLLFSVELSLLEKGLGAVAIVLAVFNVVGGFSVTDRMLRLFRSGRTDRAGAKHG
jgi:NAD(P) transhydrogenase subunit alpha